MQNLDENIISLLSSLYDKVSKFDNVSFIKDYSILKKNYSLIVDAALLKNNEVIAIFEFLPYQKKINRKDFLIKVRRLINTEYKYLIATNGIELLLVDSLKNGILYHDLDLLLEKIMSLPSEEEIDTLKNQLSNVIQNGFFDFLKMYEIEISKKNDKFSKIKELLTLGILKQNIQFDNDGQYFRLGADIRDDNNFENQLFNLLLDDVEVGTKIFRYATFETIYATLSYNSIRMNGLAGMNDSSEVDYVNKYIDKSYSFLTNPKDIELINKRFICCFSTLEDTLNQWRLYGDDGKGAYLTFEVISPLEYLPGVKIKKVNYGSKRHGKAFHLELELIKFLTEIIRVKFGYPFRLRSLDIWKHFFKPSEYSEEQEVRLLVVYNKVDNIKGSSTNFKKEWNLTTNYKIVSPYITIPLDSKILPISLRQIVIGSKQQEKYLNQVQLELFLNEKNIKKVLVNISSIDNYR